MKLRWLILMLLPAPLVAQVSNPSIIPVSSAPSGSCSQTLPLELQTPNGTLYSCQSGTWGEISGGGGGVTQIISGTNMTISPSGGTGAVTVNSFPNSVAATIMAAAHSVSYVAGDLITVGFTTQASETLAGMKAQVWAN